MARPTAATVNDRIDKEVLPAIAAVEVGLTAKLLAQTAELTERIEENSLNGLKPTLVELARQRVEQGARTSERREHIAWLLYWPRRLGKGLRNRKVIGGLLMAGLSFFGWVQFATWVWAALRH